MCTGSRICVVNQTYSNSNKILVVPFALCIILSHDVLLLKSYFFLRWEFLTGFSVGIWRNLIHEDTRVNKK